MSSVVHDVRSMMEINGYLGLLLVDLEPLSEIESECGPDVYNLLIKEICAELGRIRHETMRVGDLLCSVRPLGEQVAIFLDRPRGATALSPAALEAVADRVWLTLAPRVLELTRPYGMKGRVKLGYALALPNPMIQMERIIYRAVDHAQQMASDYSRRMSGRARERLRDLIVQKQLSPFYQPILQMEGNRVQAYEALIRGPQGSEFFTPAMLFNLASHADLVGELDRACCESVLNQLTSVPRNALLFANVLPTLINDPDFRARMLQRTHAPGMDPSRLVLELNEGVAIRSYDVLSHGIDELRAGGIRVAVDDLGAGYANLDYVVRLKPDFLKLDISLIRGVHESSVKRALIASMVEVGRAVGATVIAEGIEAREERDTLVALGVGWGQGYLFAKPAPHFATPAAMD
ncbi:MAG: EAL domain-containing protein [Myxococcaceae bacterium]